MTISIARRLGSALGVKSESKYRVINQAILEYVRLTQRSPAAPASGPDPKLMDIRLVTSTSFTLEDQDVLLVDDDTAGGVVTINLPAAATALQYPRYIKKLGTTADVLLDANASETIDDNLTVAITQEKASLTIIPDGTNWQIL